MKKQWRIYDQNPRIQRILSRELGVSYITSQILINRGITDVEEARVFLSPKLSYLHSPLLMKDMNKAVKRITSAIYNKEKILIYGDYDVDGITAVSLLTLFLRKTGADVSFRIPNREQEGYGLSIKAIREIKELGINLLITVDCGISDHKEISFAEDLDIDVIITDHHEVPDKIPLAFAVLNPRQQGYPLSFKHLAGVGVAFYLIIALRAELRKLDFWQDGAAPNLREYLDLVALGTIADVVPLIGENRIFVKFGLDELTSNSRTGIIALKEASGLGSRVIDTEMVEFRLSPRINAAGRIGQAEDGVRLLTTDNVYEAKQIAEKLDEENTRRQQIEGNILGEIEEIIERDRQLRENKVIVLASEDWHSGVIGIVASRLVEKYYKPTVLISLKEGRGKGSARSIESFHLYEGLKLCEEFLENFGGHSQAAGLTIKEDNLTNFKANFEKVVDSKLTNEDFIPRFYIDLPVNLEDISERLIEELGLLAPFGYANPPPILSSSKLNPLNFNVVGKGHLKLKIREKKRIFDAIGFGMGEFTPDPNRFIKAAFIPQINNWRGTKTIQLKLKDIMPD